ncbi:MAG: CBS domain-containing protein [Mariprofundaceae bacterium]
MIITSKIERNVVVLDDSSTTLEAAEIMIKHYIGSVVVSNAWGIKGVFTERDLMVHVIGENKKASDVKLEDVVSDAYVKVLPTDDTSHCLNLMKEHRCRHLLVFDGEDFIGVLSLRDVVTLMLEEKEHLIHQLEAYISG